MTILERYQSVYYKLKRCTLPRLSSKLVYKLNILCMEVIRTVLHGWGATQLSNLPDLSLEGQTELDHSHVACLLCF